MIAKLTGVIDSVGANWAVIDVNGVGYLAQASNRTLSRIGGRGSNVSLLIETIVREDAISLYGFCDAQEKEWFQILCTVQGVGAKVALSILSVVPPEQLPMVIASGDAAAIRQADGVGPKLATRIVTELKEKAGKIALGAAAQQQAATAQSKKGAAVPMPHSVSNDAVSALVNLGYGRAEAFAAVAGAAKTLGDGVGLDALIRESLKELSA